MRMSFLISVGLLYFSSSFGQSNNVKNQLPNQPIESATIEIAGDRNVVLNKPGIMIHGKTKGLKEGTRVIPYIKFPGQQFYSEGKARPVIDKNGEFTFRRRTSKKTYIYFMDESRTVRSGRIIIQAN